MIDEVLNYCNRTKWDNKLQAYLDRRAIIRAYCEACVGDLAHRLESVEIENATLILTFAESDSVELFNKYKDEYYLPHFRELYLECKRMIEKLGVVSNIHFTNIEAKVKEKPQRPERTLYYTRKPRLINIDLNNHTDFTRRVFAKIIKQNNDRVVEQDT